MNAATILDNVVPASAFNRGKSAKCFERAGDGTPVVVMRNNAPYRVILSTDDFSRMSEAEEDLDLACMALARLSAGSRPIPANEVYEELGIDLDGVGDVELA